jgi:hypothetical protein
MRSARALDLTAAPFADFRAQISAPDSYAESQPLGRAMRDAAIELFRFRSARDAEGGTNVAAFTPTVFRQATPQHEERWYANANAAAVDFTQGGVGRNRTAFLFLREQFLVGGRLPNPSVG